VDLESSIKPHVHKKFFEFLKKYGLHNGLSKLQERPENGLCTFRD
jgi:hypothetical protein